MTVGNDQVATAFASRPNPRRQEYLDCRWGFTEVSAHTKKHPRSRYDAHAGATSAWNLERKRFTVSEILFSPPSFLPLFEAQLMHMHNGLPPGHLRRATGFHLRQRGYSAASPSSSPLLHRQKRRRELKVAMATTTTMMTTRRHPHPVQKEMEGEEYRDRGWTTMCSFSGQGYSVRTSVLSEMVPGEFFNQFSVKKRKKRKK